MSFNIGANSSKHRANDTEWIKRLSDIIIMSNPDIVLLQEVPARDESDTKEEFLRRLKDQLKSNKWKSISTVKALSNKEHPEKTPSFTLNNAVLFNSDILLAYLDGRYPINFADKNNFSSYKTRFNNLQVITFSFKDSLGDKFLVINTHTYASDPESDIKSICNVINSYCNNQPYIIGGDINLSLSKTCNAFNKNTISTFRIDGFDNFTGIPLKTSLSSNNSKGKIIFANDYDHFIYSSNIDSIYTIKHAITEGKSDYYSSNQIKINNETFKNNSEFINKVSDHFPVIITLDIKFNE